MQKKHKQIRSFAAPASFAIIKTCIAIVPFVIGGIAKTRSNSHDLEKLEQITIFRRVYRETGNLTQAAKAAKTAGVDRNKTKQWVEDIEFEDPRIKRAKQLYQELNSTKKVAKAMGVHPTTVSSWIKDLVTEKIEGLKREKEAKKEIALNLYKNTEIGSSEIARQLHVTGRDVVKWLEEEGLKPKGKPGKLSSRISKATVDDLLTFAEKMGCFQMKDIKKHLNITETVAYRLLKEATKKGCIQRKGKKGQGVTYCWVAPNHKKSLRKNPEDLERLEKIIAAREFFRAPCRTFT